MQCPLEKARLLCDTYIDLKLLENSISSHGDGKRKKEQIPTTENVIICMILDFLFGF